MELRLSLLKKYPAEADTSYSGKFLVPLIAAVKRNRMDLVKLLLYYGADPNIPINDGGYIVSAYSTAVNRGYYGMVRLLIEYGADPYYCISFENGTKKNLNNSGNHSFINIPFDNRFWKAFYQIKHFAASPDWSYAENLFLHSAAKNNNWLKARALLDAGALVDIQDENGVTPLMSAAYNGSIEVFNILLQRGADVFIKDNQGHYVLDYACARQLS